MSALTTMKGQALVHSKPVPSAQPGTIAAENVAFELTSLPLSHPT